jgi:hypothetical protein
MIVTGQPIGAVAGDRLETFGGPGVMKTVPLLSVPAMFITTGPVVAPVGTIAVTLAELQLVTLATIPLNATVLVPWVGPKSAPAMVTTVPAGPNGGDKLNIAGTLATVKTTGSLATPPTVTITFPVVAPVGIVPVMDVADQFIMVSPVPFTVTVLLPCVSPKLEPSISTADPRSPLVGETLEINGVGRTVNCTRLLFTPST